MQRKSIGLLMFILFPIFLYLQPTFGQILYIPVDDPVNRDVTELQGRGYLEDFSATERPWLRSDVIESIMADETAFDPESKKLADRIMELLKPPQRKPSENLSAGFNAGIELRGLSRERRRGYFLQRDRFISRDFKNEFGSVYKAGWWISGDDRWGADTRLIFDSDGTGYPWYYGTAHNHRIIGQFDHAYFALDLGRFDLLLGRQRLSWGPSPRGSLLLDGNSPPLDLVKIDFELKPFGLSAFATRLDDYYDPLTGQSNNRYLSGHRLRLRPGKGWEIAASEVVLYGGPGRLPEIYYNIPILLNYWEGQNRKIDDNIVWNIDISWIRPHLGHFYLQFVADDIVYKGNSPQKFAIQLGTYLVPARLDSWSAIFEINFVDTYTFGQRKRKNAYLNWATTIGRLDSDQLELFAGIYKKISADLRSGIEYTRREKGEYDAEDAHPSPLPLDTKFPSGIVEKIDDIRLFCEWQIIDKSEIKITLGHQSVENYLHQNEYSLNQFYSMVEISFGLDAGLPFWTEFH
jgi:hypothetical protein